MCPDAGHRGTLVYSLQLTVNTNMNEGLIYAAVSKDTALIKVTGRGTFLNSHVIKKWLLAKMEEGCKNFVLDISDCLSMDSTFMGTITGFSLKLKRHGMPPLTVANITMHNKRLLETLGLDKFLEIKEKLDIDSAVKWDVLSVESLDKLTTTKHMIESHEEIMGTGGVAERQFKTVHELLKKDIEKQLGNKKTDS